MKKLFIILLITICSTFTHAQSTFEHVFIANHNVVDVESCFKSIELPNGDYITMGSNPGCQFCQKPYYIRRYDHQGILIFEKSIIAGSGGDYPDIIQTKDGNLLFYFGYGFPTTNLTWDYRLYFYKMDLNGDTLFTKNYYYQRLDQNYIYQIQLNELVDSSIVFSCSEILLKLNPNLDSIKAVNIPRPFFDAFLRSNKNEIVSPKSYPTSHGDSLSLIVYDNNLDSVRTIAFPDSNYTSATGYGWGIGAISEFRPNKIFSVSRKGFGNMDSLGLVLFDSTLNIQWIQYIVVPIHTLYFMSINFNLNTVTYFGSKIDLTFNGNDSALFYRLNINTGDSLQFKTFVAKNIYRGTQLRDLKYCSEGYLISGWAKADTTGQESYFAVLDTLGNVTTSIPKVDTYPMQVFSNPTTNIFSVEIQGEKQFQYILTDAAGRILESKKGKGKMDFDLGNYSAGNYFLSVTGDQVKRSVIIIKQ